MLHGERVSGAADKCQIMAEMRGVESLPRAPVSCQKMERGEDLSGDDDDEYNQDKEEDDNEDNNHVDDFDDDDYDDDDDDSNDDDNEFDY